MSGLGAELRAIADTHERSARLSDAMCELLSQNMSAGPKHMDRLCENFNALAKNFAALLNAFPADERASIVRTFCGQAEQHRQLLEAEAAQFPRTH